MNVSKFWALISHRPINEIVKSYFGVLDFLADESDSQDAKKHIWYERKMFEHFSIPRNGRLDENSLGELIGYYSKKKVPLIFDMLIYQESKWDEDCDVWHVYNGIFPPYFSSFEIVDEIPINRESEKYDERKSGFDIETKRINIMTKLLNKNLISFYEDSMNKTYHGKFTDMYLYFKFKYQSKRSIFKKNNRYMKKGFRENFIQLYEQLKWYESEQKLTAIDIGTDNINSIIKRAEDSIADDISYEKFRNMLSELGLWVNIQ